MIFLNLEMSSKNEPLLGDSSICEVRRASIFLLFGVCFSRFQDFILFGFERILLPMGPLLEILLATFLNSKSMLKNEPPKNERRKTSEENLCAAGGVVGGTGRALWQPRKITFGLLKLMQTIGKTQFR